MLEFKTTDHAVFLGVLSMHLDNYEKPETRVKNRRVLLYREPTVVKVKPEYQKDFEKETVVIGMLQDSVQRYVVLHTSGRFIVANAEYFTQIERYTRKIKRNESTIRRH